jgi:hypothetical protein
MFPKNNMFLHYACVNILFGLNLVIFSIFGSKSSASSFPVICINVVLELIGNRLFSFLHS